MNKNICLLTIFYMILLSSCVTEARMASVWTTARPQINYPDDIEELEHSYIPLNYQKKYIKLLEKDAFILIDSNEYKEISDKIPQKKYTIAVRSVSFITDMQLPIAFKYTNVYRIKGRSDLVIWEGAAFEPDWKTIRFHRVVLTVEVDELPEVIYVIPAYNLNRLRYRHLLR